MRAGAWLGTRAEDRRRPLGVLVSAVPVLVAAVLALTGGAEPESDPPRVVSAADLAGAAPRSDASVRLRATPGRSSRPGKPRT